MANRDANQTSGCWIQIFEDTNYNDNSLILNGPAEFANMRALPGAGGYDWGDQIGSVMTGASCWVWAFADENYQDTSIWIGPNSQIPDLGDMEDEIDSMKLFDHPPSQYLQWLRNRNPMFIASKHKKHVKKSR